MRFRRLWVSVFASAGVLVGVASQGCGIFDNTATSEDRICTPGANVFCRCADRAQGTKPCLADGKTFGSCVTSDNGKCVGGEISDPNTGTVVEPTNPGDSSVQVPANDTCPGKAIAVVPNVDINVSDDTTSAKDDANGQGACAVGGGAPDQVYHLTPTGTGALTIKVQGAGNLAPVAYIRTACEDVTTQVSCAPIAPGNVAQLRLNVTTGRDYFLYVDGSSAGAGKYSITGKLTPGIFCGDGHVDTNEACDDGNKTEGDGCSNDCHRVDGDPSSASCAGGGQPVDVWPGQTVSGSGSNAPLPNTWTRTTSACTVSPSTDYNIWPEHVYAVTAHANGSLKVIVTPEAGFNAQLVARSSCDDPTTQTGCANDGSSGSAETMIVPVSDGQKVFVAVDGAGTVEGKGNYTVTFQIP